MISARRRLAVLSSMFVEMGTLAQLRRKLEDDPSCPVHLLTEAGMGYRFSSSRLVARAVAKGPQIMRPQTLPWVFVLWFAAFCGVVLITAGLIGSSR